jgi:flavodoxin
LDILIVYYSESGNTKKVVDMTESRLNDLGHQVKVKNALTVTAEQVNIANMLIIGTPVHGKIIFGMKPAKAVKEFLKEQLPDDMEEKPVIGFATYLFFPAKALNPVRDAIESRNGKILNLIAKRRTKKPELVAEILESLEKM